MQFPQNTQRVYSSSPCRNLITIDSDCGVTPSIKMPSLSRRAIGRQSLDLLNDRLLIAPEANFATVNDEQESYGRTREKISLLQYDEHTFYKKTGKPPTTQRNLLPRPNTGIPFRTLQHQEEPLDDIEEDRISRNKRNLLSSGFLDSCKSPSALKQPLKIKQSTGLTFGRRKSVSSNLNSEGDTSTYDVSQLLMKTDQQQKFVSLSHLQQEQDKRHKLKMLYAQQAQSNENLKSENNELQNQQRALLSLLQAKDSKVESLQKNQGGARVQILGRLKWIFRAKLQKWFDKWRLNKHRSGMLKLACKLDSRLLAQAFKLWSHWRKQSAKVQLFQKSIQVKLLRKVFSRLARLNSKVKFGLIKLQSLFRVVRKLQMQKTFNTLATLQNPRLVLKRILDNKIKRQLSRALTSLKLNTLSRTLIITKQHQKLKALSLILCSQLKHYFNRFKHQLHLATQQDTYTNNLKQMQIKCHIDIKRQSKELQQSQYEQSSEVQILRLKVEQLRNENIQYKQDLDGTTQELIQLQQSIQSRDHESEDAQLALIKDLETKTGKLIELQVEYDQSQQVAQQLQQQNQLLQQQHQQQLQQVELEVSRYIHQIQQRHQQLLQDQQSQQKDSETRLKQQNMEIAQELVNCSRELVIERQEVKRMQSEVQGIQSVMQTQDLESQQLKSSQLLQQSQIQKEQSRQQLELRQLRKERDSLEQQLKQALLDVQRQKDATHSRDSIQLQSFREENSVLKKQMFNVDKQVNQLEQQLGDQEDMNRRLVKDFQDQKRKTDKVIKERQEAFDSLESYQVIFEKCERSMLKMQQDAEVLKRERDEALEECRLVRQRYADILK